MSQTYWARNPNAPFATLIAAAAGGCHPESWEGAYDQLKRFAKADTEKSRRFKAELRQALLDPSQLPGNEPPKAVEYDDGSPEKFLRRLWRDLYPGEPLPGQG